MKKRIAFSLKAMLLKNQDTVESTVDVTLVYTDSINYGKELDGEVGGIFLKQIIY